MESTKILRLVRDGLYLHDVRLKEDGRHSTLHENVKRRGKVSDDYSYDYNLQRLEPLTTEGAIERRDAAVIERSRGGNLVIEIPEPDWSAHVELSNRHGSARKIDAPQGMHLLKSGDWMFRDMFCPGGKGSIEDTYLFFDFLDCKFHADMDSLKMCNNLPGPKMPIGRYVPVMYSRYRNEHTLCDILWDMPAVDRMQMMPVLFPLVNRKDYYHFYDGEELNAGWKVEMVHKDSKPWDERLRFTIS